MLKSAHTKFLIMCSPRVEVSMSSDNFWNVMQEMMKKKVMKPYSPLADGSTAEVNPKEGAYIWSPQHLSSFGSNTG